MELNRDTSLLINSRKKMVNNYIERNLDIDDDVLEESVKHLPIAGGKRLRPIILILSAEAVSDVEHDNVTPVAAGFEALHTSSLIQDDHPSMDDHSMRRGVSTVHEKYDSAVSVLSSDILRSKATTWCTRIDRPTSTITRIIEEFDRTVEDMCIGQRKDLSFEKGEQSVTIEDYMDMIGKKTARMYGSCAKCGAITSQGSEREIETFERFGYQLGVGFQIVDDILDIRSAKTGKDSNSDIRNNKRTIVTMHANDKGKPIFSDSYTVEDKIGMIEEAGSVEYAKELAEEQIDDAIQEIEGIDCGGSEQSLEALVEIAEETKARNR